MPLPVPLVPALRVIHVTPLLAVHAQVLPAVTPTLLEPPSAATLALVALSVYVQVTVAPACVIVTV